MSCAVLSGALFTGACNGNDDENGTRRDAGSDGPNFAPMPFDASACGAVMQYHTVAPSPHVQDCLPLSFETNPPSSGAHYGNWAAFQEYDHEVPWGFLVHAMEHGAVVVAYDCPSGCTAEVDAARQWLDTLPGDPQCLDPTQKRRVILVPAAGLPSPWAAAAWGVTLTASCFEPAVFTEFHQRTYGKAPENLCAPGITLTDAEGGTPLPPGCGTPSFDAGAN